MTIQSILTLVVIFVLYVLGKNALGKLVHRIGTERRIPAPRVQYVSAAISVVWTIISVAAAGMAAGFGYRDVGLFFGSFLAVMGIALFAHWSILSNITSSVVVFFFFPYRVGNYVKILDGDNTVEGRIREITLFHVIMEHEQNLITYPNTMVFQKAVQISPGPDLAADSEQQEDAPAGQNRADRS